MNALSHSAFARNTADLWVVNRENEIARFVERVRKMIDSGGSSGGIENSHLYLTGAPLLAGGNGQFGGLPHGGRQIVTAHFKDAFPFACHWIKGGYNKRLPVHSLVDVLP